MAIRNFRECDFSLCSVCLEIVILTLHRRFKVVNVVIGEHCSSAAATRESCSTSGSVNIISNNATCNNASLVLSLMASK